MDDDNSIMRNTDEAIGWGIFRGTLGGQWERLNFLISAVKILEVELRKLIGISIFFKHLGMEKWIFHHYISKTMPVIGWSHSLQATQTESL